MSAAWRRRAALCVLPVLVAACASTPKNPPPPAVPVPPPLEASYDWHGLLLVPFGSTLREIPFALHEVLLFHDASQPPQADDAECYAMERAAPRFVAHSPSEYMLCFKHDRLARVQATVMLPQADAAQIFGDACSLWQRKAAAGVPGARQPAAGAAQGASASDIAAAAPVAPGDGRPEEGRTGACDGRDGGIAYAGRLDQEITQADVPMTVTLEAAVLP